MCDDNTRIFLLYMRCVTNGYDNQNKAYSVSCPKNKLSQLELLQINVDAYVKSIKIHKTADGCNVIVRRDL